MERQRVTEHMPHVGNATLGSDAWSREAGRVRRLAACGAIALDEDELCLLDIHDLQALSAHLCRAHDPPRGRAAAAFAWVGVHLMGRQSGVWRHPA